MKKSTKQSETEYDFLYTKDAANLLMEEVEYYKVIAALLKGTKSVDIGCGFGTISMFSPDTVGVDFSEAALQVAKKNGVKNLVKADAQELPFEDDEFEVSISMGVLEHVSDIKKAISEMVRVSKIQILIVHAALPYGLESIKKPLAKILGLKEQPIENPQKMSDLQAYLKNAGARTIIEGTWNYIDLRWINKNIPYGAVKWPSHHFIVSIKTPNLERKFLGDADFTKLD